jgi:allophanate hydrolase
MKLSLDISTLRDRYRRGEITPGEVIEQSLTRIAQTRSENAWIHVLSRVELDGYLAALDGRDAAALPLYGIPFAIKDNIDLAGVPTTAACPDYAYTPRHSAPVVARLIAAGAIPLGKTNLDQFATGLVGTRSPYGPGHNAFSPDYIAGGSSAGSAIAVANGSVSFALGTDTAGSGRVPAAFNNLLGLKPTRGLLSTRGVVPACRSLDCVSVFALSAADAREVLAATASFDEEDPFSRAQALAGHEVPAEGFRFGVPRSDQLAFFGNADYAALFEQAVARLRELGGTPVTIDFAPFLDAARLLYDGPWLAERYAAIEPFIQSRPEALFPVTRSIIERGVDASAVAAFKAHYRLAELKRTADAVWREVDVVLTPTAGTHFTIAEVASDPVRRNAQLGYYTNFMNLLDYSAVAVPAGFTAQGLPFGVTLFAPAFADQALLALAERWQRAAALPLGATGFPPPAAISAVPAASRRVQVVVCGAHMRGLPLEPRLTDRGGVLRARTHTAPVYRLYALAGGSPQRPGLVRVTQGGAAIACEVWELPVARYGEFVAEIPAPLGIGTVLLANGTRAQGFLCEAAAVDNALDITDLGGWRAYLAGKHAGAG